MRVTYSGVSYNGHGSRITVDEPNSCPWCRYSLKPTNLFSKIIKDEQSTPYFYVVYLCTHCRTSFVCKFSNITTLPEANCYAFNKLDLIAPKQFEKKHFAECIQDISPSFVEIYNQALEAEHHNLEQIAGIGYRKALEFLIKDFLIKHEEKEASKVISTALGSCIDTMIDNPQLKLVATRATWLGNDQTHYVQKYEDKDIEDLKRLIKLSVNWIEMICLTDDVKSIEKK